MVPHIWLRTISYSFWDESCVFHKYSVFIKEHWHSSYTVQRIEGVSPATLHKTQRTKKESVSACVLSSPWLTGLYRWCGKFWVVCKSRRIFLSYWVGFHLGLRLLNTHVQVKLPLSQGHPKACLAYSKIKIYISQRGSFKRKFIIDSSVALKRKKAKFLSSTIGPRNG